MGGSGANGLKDSPNPSPKEYLFKGLSDSMFINVCGCHQPIKKFINGKYSLLCSHFKCCNATFLPAERCVMTLKTPAKDTMDNITLDIMYFFSFTRQTLW